MKKKTGFFLSSVLLVIIGIFIGLGLTNQPESKTVLRAESTNTLHSNQESDINSFNEAFISVAEAANPAVVMVSTEKTAKRQTRRSPFYEDDRFRDFFDRFFKSPTPEGEFSLKGLGSGVIIKEDGYILTNNHVVDKVDDIWVKITGEKKYKAKIVGTDPKTDVAVLKIDEKNLPVIPLGDSDKLRIGEWVLAIGSPFGEQLAHTVTAGIVSALGRSDFNLTGREGYEDFIQTDAAINPGNSGGALVNLKGELVGINSAIISGSRGFQGVGFAVPINLAKDIMEQLIEKGKVVRGYIGIGIQDIDEDAANALNLKDLRGILVREISNNSPAEKSDLKVGDIITKLNGENVDNVSKLRNRVAATSPGIWINLNIIRDGEEKTVKVKLGELPEDDTAFSPVEKKEEVIGITVSEITPSVASRFDIDADERGVVITDIAASGVGAKAGFKVGDVIKKVNKKDIKSVSDYELAVKSLKKGESALVLIKRTEGTFFISFRIPE